MPPSLTPAKFAAMLERCSIKADDGCWLWTGAMSRGYGYVSRRGKMLPVHRASYETFKGPIPEGHDVLHKCDVTNCLAPDHLFTGTAADNMADMKAKGRTGDRNPSGLRGHRRGAAREMV